jgi:hypothetical protein
VIGCCALDPSPLSEFARNGIVVEFSEHSCSNWEARFLFHRERIDMMECRDFLLKLTFGFVAVTALFAAAAQAAPISPMNAASAPIHASSGTQPALVSQDEVNRIRPEQVRWHHHGGWHHHGHWHHRHWGWHHRHWHRHYWHHRHWRHHHRHW